MVVRQDLTSINEGYGSLGQRLRSRAAELGGLAHQVQEAQQEAQDMIAWLRDAKTSTDAWTSGAAEKQSVKMQLEQQKVGVGGQGSLLLRKLKHSRSVSGLV